MTDALRFAWIAVFGLIIAVASPTFAAEDEIYTGTFSNTAVSGYDPVTYFREGRAVKGTDDFVYTWKGANWNFSSAENLAAFKANPENFAPQFGGYCAFAVAEGHTASADPEVWTIVDGKLYLNYNTEVRSRWKWDVPGNIAKGDKNWPGVLGR